MGLLGKSLKRRQKRKIMPVLQILLVLIVVG
jgi:hypothetical protein